MSGKSLKCNDRYVVILIWKNCEKKKNDTFSLKKSLEKDLESEIAKTAEQEGKEERVQEALQITEMLKNHPMKFDDKMLRKILKKVEVLSTEEIRITFTGGLQVVQKMQDTLKRMPIRYA